MALERTKAWTALLIVGVSKFTCAFSIMQRYIFSAIKGVFTVFSKPYWTAAEILISYKPGVKFDVFITGQADAYMLIYSLWDKSLIHLQEQFMAVFLNNKLQVIGYRTLYTGNMTCCCIDIRLLASLALHCMASSVIVAHNHPSGSLEPSAADIRLTKAIRKALVSISVTLNDHFIITAGGWLSMREKGLL